MDRKSTKILVIDDVQAVRRQLRRLLINAGFPDVTMAESGEDGMSLIDSGQYHVILCDWHLIAKKKYTHRTINFQYL